MSELELTQTRSVSDVSPGSRRRMQAGPDAQREREAQRPPAVEDRRRDIHAQAHAETAAERTAEETAADNADDESQVTREDVESIEIELPGGVIALIGPPPGIALQLKVSSILGNDLNAYSAQVTRAMLCVREVDGKKVAQIGDRIGVQKVMNQVGGEDAVDLITLALQKYWPPVTVKDLKVVKKNLR